MSDEFKDELKQEQQDAEDQRNAVPGSSTDGDDNNQRMTFYSREPVRTVEDAIKKAEIDTKVWEVERFLVNSWEVGAKGPDGAIQVTPLWQVKCWLRRISPLLTRLDDLLEQLHAASPKVTAHYAPARSEGGRHAAEIAIMDTHLGGRY